MHARYAFLHTLYTCPTPTLLSLHCGIIEMIGVPDYEWYGRVAMLVGRVDDTCTVDARVEEYLLGIGRGAAEMQVELVEMCGAMEAGKRAEWARKYRAGLEFLGRVMEGWCMGEDWKVRRGWERDVRDEAGEMCRVMEREGRCWL